MHTNTAKFKCLSTHSVSVSSSRVQMLRPMHTFVRFFDFTHAPCHIPFQILLDLLLPSTFLARTPPQQHFVKRGECHDGIMSPTNKPPLTLER